MSRCRENAGMLFPRRCDQEATRQCSRCGRAVCNQHFRAQANTNQDICLSCVREGLADRHQRGTFSHLADDPYFFWYYHSPDMLDVGFTGQDFGLFDDAGGGDWSSDFDHDWGGS